MWGNQPDKADQPSEADYGGGQQGCQKEDKKPDFFHSNSQHPSLLLIYGKQENLAAEQKNTSQTKEAENCRERQAVQADSV